MGDSENRRNGPQFTAGPLITSASMVGAGTLIAQSGSDYYFGPPAGEAGATARLSNASPRFMTVATRLTMHHDWPSPMD